MIRKQKLPKLNPKLPSYLIQTVNRICDTPNYPCQKFSGKTFIELSEWADTNLAIKLSRCYTEPISKYNDLHEMPFSTSDAFKISEHIFKSEKFKQSFCESENSAHWVIVNPKNWEVRQPKNLDDIVLKIHFVACLGSINKKTYCDVVGFWLREWVSNESLPWVYPKNDSQIHNLWVNVRTVIRALKYYDQKLNPYHFREWVEYGIDESITVNLYQRFAMSVKEPFLKIPLQTFLSEESYTDVWNSSHNVWDTTKQKIESSNNEIDKKLIRFYERKVREQNRTKYSSSFHI